MKIKKVLFVSHGFPCFMSDILFHGLKVLGYDVTEYPQGTHYYGGGSTFGGRKDIGKNDFLSFCYFNFPKKDLTDEQILNQDYDVVILTSWIPEKPWVLENIYKRFLDKIPIAFVDGEDDIILRNYSIKNNVYFKRELLTETEGINPITFAIIDNGDNDLCLKRKYLLSFIASGHSLDSLRSKMFRNLAVHPERFRMYFSDVERSKTRMLPYKEYRNILKSSQIGINIVGEGQDTYRFWEIPYYGALLMSQELDIKIENNFTDGENAIFFKNIDDFNSKFAYLSKHLDEVEEFARAGREHLLKYHTSKNRAEYVINKLEELL